MNLQNKYAGIYTRFLTYLARPAHHPAKNLRIEYFKIKRKEDSTWYIIDIIFLGKCTSVATNIFKKMEILKDIYRFRIAQHKGYIRYIMYIVPVYVEVRFFSGFCIELNKNG